MKRIADRLRVGGPRSKRADWNPASTPGCDGKEEAAERVTANLARIDELQYRLYAEARQSLLIVLQGMDTCGKDGAIRKVMTVFNPAGCKVSSFKAPNSEELAHDFLWRIHKAAPGRGEVAIFNRSHYEDVLIVRVRELVPRSVWSRRYRSINVFERHLREHGTRVIKFFLNISREEQRERLLARLEEPAKRWKFSDGDLEERKLWSSYQRAYQDALVRCSTRHAPWYVVPADRKWYRDLAISEIVADTLEDMSPRLPKVKLDVAGLQARLRR